MHLIWRLSVYNKWPLAGNVLRSVIRYWRRYDIVVTALLVAFFVLTVNLAGLNIAKFFLFAAFLISLVGFSVFMVNFRVPIKKSLKEMRFYYADLQGVSRNRVFEACLVWLIISASVLVLFLGRAAYVQSATGDAVKIQMSDGVLTTGSIVLIGRDSIILSKLGKQDWIGFEIYDATFSVIPFSEVKSINYSE